MSKAAVLTGVMQPLEIRDDVEVEAPRSHELKVRLVASGVCHTDLSLQNGTMPTPTPIVLGHEGAGVVEEIGPDVNDFEIGDHVVISWVPQCGECYYCSRGQAQLCEKATLALATGGLLDGTTRMTSHGAPLHQMVASGTFSEWAVVADTGAVKIPKDFDLKLAALIGCGVLTGAGAALNTARIEPGDAVAVLGCGGVGLNTIQGARIAGAGEIIAIDMSETKLQLAREFGATSTVNVSDKDAVGEVLRLTDNRGADVAFEVIGLQQTIEQSISMTRRGGQAILVGVPKMDVMLSVPATVGVVMQEKTIKGSWYGSANVRRDIPRMIELYRSGELMLDQLVSQTIKLEQVNEAFAAIEAGEVARTIIAY